MNSDRLSSYARLLIETGVALQKGQTLIISCPVECADFGRLCAAAAYTAGAGEVVMNWNDDFLRRQKFLYADDRVFDTHPAWRTAFYNDYAKQHAAYLCIDSEDPDVLAGVDADRIQRAEISTGRAIKYFRDCQTANEFAWCVASAPSAAWAKKVFPTLPADMAIEKLWDAILNASLAFEGVDPRKEWKKHNALLHARMEKLNTLSFKSLHYVNSIGTDLTVDLPENHFWAGGSEVTADGIEFCANIPSEEIFTAPKRDGVCGTVHASLPLVLNGNMVENFSFRLEQGKIVEVHAEKGEEVLKKAIAVDEGACYLGEVALVPWDSPIAQSGLLFYNTLFDENAACHFAFGCSYPCVKDSAPLSAEERLSLGLNDSMTHVDFMIGTEDLKITGKTRDGKELPVFENGVFVL